MPSRFRSAASSRSSRRADASSEDLEDPIHTSHVFRADFERGLGSSVVYKESVSVRCLQGERTVWHLAFVGGALLVCLLRECGLLRLRELGVGGVWGGRFVVGNTRGLRRAFVARVHARGPCCAARPGVETTFRGKFCGMLASAMMMG